MRELGASAGEAYAAFGRGDLEGYLEAKQRGADERGDSGGG
jgi:hypothetical protein